MDIRRGVVPAAGGRGQLWSVLRRAETTYPACDSIPRLMSLTPTLSPACVLHHPLLIAIVILRPSRGIFGWCSPCSAVVRVERRVGLAAGGSKLAAKHARRVVMNVPEFQRPTFLCAPPSPDVPSLSSLHPPGTGRRLPIARPVSLQLANGGGRGALGRGQG